MNEPIRILNVLAQRPSGGIESYLINMHENIDTSKIQFDYIVCDSEPIGEFDRKINNLGGKVYVFSPIRYKNLFKYIREMNNFFKTQKHYKIVHGHFTSLASIYLFIAKKYGIKHCIVHSHNTKYSDYKFRSFRNYILQIPLKIVANHYFACSIKAGEFLFGKKSINQNRVFIAKNAIDAERFRFNQNEREKIRRDLNIEGKLVIGHIGRMCYQKNHDFLVDIFAELYKRKNESVLLLIGNGELEDKIRNKVNKLGIDNAVMFLGVRSDIPQILQAIDLFILPSRYEGLPLVGIETQASGIKMIVSEEVSDEVKITNLVKFLSLQEPPSKWAEVALKFFNNYERRDTYDEIVQSGYEIKNAVKKLEGAYLGFL